VSFKPRNYFLNGVGMYVLIPDVNLIRALMNYYRESRDSVNKLISEVNELIHGKPLIEAEIVATDIIASILRNLYNGCLSSGEDDEKCGDLVHATLMTIMYLALDMFNTVTGRGGDDSKGVL